MATLKEQLIRLGNSNPELRDHIRPVLQVVESRFEKGVPADPTENMSEEDAEKWEEMKDEYGDKFKKDSSPKKPLYAISKRVVSKFTS